jgi:hypothetical protein
MENQENKKIELRGRKKSRLEKRKLIECHPELITILDELRDPLKEFTWGVIDKSVGYYELTAILARKIKGKPPTKINTN